MPVGGCHFDLNPTECIFELFIKIIIPSISTIRGNLYKTDLN